MELAQKRAEEATVFTLDTYMLDLGGAFLSFAGDAEASVLVLGEYLGRICIKTEASH